MADLENINHPKTDEEKAAWIKNFMASSGRDRQTAEFALAMELDELPGDLIAVDSDDDLPDELK